MVLSTQYMMLNIDRILLSVYLLSYDEKLIQDVNSDVIVYCERLRESWDRPALACGYIVRIPLHANPYNWNGSVGVFHSSM